MIHWFQWIVPVRWAAAVHGDLLCGTLSMLRDLHQRMFRLTRMVLPLLLALSGHVHSQDSLPTVDLPAGIITVDDGLPQGMVRAILQDREGYMWFGTKDGLARSDGYSFTVFRHDAHDSTSIAADHVIMLFEDDQGFIWVGLDAVGMDRYDPRTGQFSRVEVRAPRDAPQYPLFLHFMAQDTLGHLYVTDKWGQLYAVEGARNSRPMLVRPDEALRARIPAEEVMDLYVEANGDLWILYYEELVAVPHSGNGWGEPVHFALPAHRLGVDRMEDRYCLLVDAPNGQLWMICAREFLGYDLATNTLGERIALPRAIRGLGGYTMDGRGRWWGGVRAGPGLMRIDPRERRMELVQLVPQNHNIELPDLMLSSRYVDRSGNLWFGSGGAGALKYSPGTERFARALHHHSRWLMDPDGHGRYVVAREGQEVVHGPSGPGTRTPVGLHPSGGDEINSWGATMVDPRGDWWGILVDPTFDRRDLYRFSPSEGRTPMGLGQQTFPHDLLLREGDTIILASSSKGTLLTDQLLVFDTRSQRVVDTLPLPTPVQENEYKSISQALRGPDGALWLATINGLYARSRSGEWTSYHAAPSDTTALPVNVLFSICEDPLDPSRYLWVGTNGGGLVRLDRSTGRFMRIGLAQGLPNQVVYSLVPDTMGGIWMGTNNGLARYDVRNGAFLTFTQADGLAGNEFNRYGGVRADDGRLFFSGVDGVTSFRPEDVLSVGSPTPTRITGLMLADVPVRSGRFILPGKDGPLLPVPIGRMKRIELPYDQRMITFSFACMDHTAPAKNRFRFRLEGFNTAWIDNGISHEATFTNLDPGTYTFRVQGRNSAGVWDEQGASIELVITPPWWGTWWFRGGLFAVFGGLIYGVYRYRLAEALRLANVRDRIARDLHDEIGSTLSSVALFSEVARRDGDEQKRNAMLERIGESTSRMVESMNDIVWAVNSRNDDLLHVTQRMREFASRVAEARGFDTVFDFPDLEGRNPLSMVQRKNLFLIFKEAVSNAAKYSECKRLRVSMHLVGGRVELQVHDDGVGLHSGGTLGQRGGGNGLGNMQVRAKEINGDVSVVSAPGEGTTVKLTFAT